MNTCQQAIAVFGGTFDPVHYGHLRAAAEVAEQLDVRDFRLLPAGQPPHRPRAWADAYHRLAMLELALAPYPDLTVDDREVRRRGPSYMVDTLVSLRRQFASLPILLCLGQDAANGLHRWHRWRSLFDLAHLVIMTRPRSEPCYREELREHFEQRRVSGPNRLMNVPAGALVHLEVTQLAISSTDIREQLADGRDPRFLLPATVLAYIRKHRLYRPNALTQVAENEA